MRYYLDTEFNEFGGDLISLALVRGDGAELYLATHCPSPGPWVRAHVMPLVRLVSAIPILVEPKDFGAHIALFMSGDENPVVVVDWPDDIIYFCRALITAPGEMVAVPRLKFELERVDAYPTTLEGAIQHNALWDARALKHLFNYGRVDRHG